MRRLISLLFFMAIVIFGISQRTVTGRVLDESNSFPLQGAIVTAKGGMRFKETDVNGIFRMNIGDTIKTLVISYIDFEEKEISIGESEWFDIRLEKVGFINEAAGPGNRNNMSRRVEATSPVDSNHVAKLKGKDKHKEPAAVFNCMSNAGWKMFK